MGFMDFSITSTLFGTNGGARRVEEGSEATRVDEALPLKDNSTSPGSSPDSRPSFSGQPRTLQASLPSSWYASEKFFDLESRAIFAQVTYLLNCAYLQGLASCYP
jgi:hypothetical protein